MNDSGNTEFDGMEGLLRCDDVNTSQSEQYTSSGSQWINY